MPTAILVCALAGIASTFLGDASVWSMRHATPAPAIVYLLGFVVAGGIALARRRGLLRWHAIAALTGVLCSLFVYRGALRDIATLGPLREHTLASLLYAVALYGGVVATIAAALKAPRATS